MNIHVHTVYVYMVHIIFLHVHSSFVALISLQFLVEVFHKKPDLLLIERKDLFLIEVCFPKAIISSV